MEFRVLRPSGDVRTLVCTSEVLLDDEGAPEVFFGACQDVTDDRRLQEESVARQKLESLGTLAGGIAHDFNNLLGAVLAQTELAMSELAAGSEPHEELGAIRDVAIRGSEIVRQLMIYAGKENDSVGTVDVSRVVEGMRGLLKVAVSRHATLVTDLGEDLPIRARPAQISQIVMNLVVNASEALGDRDGVVRVTTKHMTIARRRRSPKRCLLENMCAWRFPIQAAACHPKCRQGIRPVLHNKVFGPRPRPCGGARDRSESSWSYPGCEPARRGQYVRGPATVRGNRG